MSFIVPLKRQADTDQTLNPDRAGIPAQRKSVPHVKNLPPSKTWNPVKSEPQIKKVTPSYTVAPANDVTVPVPAIALTPAKTVPARALTPAKTVPAIPLNPAKTVPAIALTQAKTVPAKKGPKKPITPFLTFVKRNMSKVDKMGLSREESHQKLMRMWIDISPEEKSQLELRFNKQKEVYENALQRKVKSRKKKGKDSPTIF